MKARQDVLSLSLCFLLFESEAMTKAAVRSTLTHPAGSTVDKSSDQRHRQESARLRWIYYHCHAQTCIETCASADRSHTHTKGKHGNFGQRVSFCAQLSTHVLLLSKVERNVWARSWTCSVRVCVKMKKHYDGFGSELTMGAHVLESNSSGNLTPAVSEPGTVLPGYLVVIDPVRAYDHPGGRYCGGERFGHYGFYCG